jgi:4'-phosphopantetheinyl transferase
MLNPMPMTASEQGWNVPSAALMLSSRDVHVWRTSLELSAWHVQRLRQTLTADEISRAERFYFERDRRHFVVARGVLRMILSRYLGLDARQLGFAYSSYGKPALATAPARDWLRFNLSHSHELALYAITYGREVGIDIEYIHDRIASEEIAAHYFSPHELMGFRALPVSQRRDAFFACWTRKEAYIKARGEGLSLPLDQFDVSLAPGEPAALLRTLGDAHEAARWSLRALSPGVGYAAALVVEGHDWQMTCWQWTPSWSTCADPPGERVTE